MSNKISNETVFNAYSARSKELFEIVNGLESDIKEFIIDANEARWGHVGDLGRALEIAKQLHNFLRGKPDA